jgi:putative pyruvate formate lyase activating enzyme
MEPAYLKTYKSGKLQQISRIAHAMLQSCVICPRQCKVNRLNNEKGYCKAGLKARVFNYLPHHGEEPAISGNLGSGTIFFSNCNMACVYCQNYEFSQLGKGREVGDEELAQIMIELQDSRCHNINLVTPTHIVPQIIQGLVIAVSKGLKIPLVYNCSGYESAQVIKMLDGIIDVYLTDMRYGLPSEAKLYSDAPDYPEHNRQAIIEMHRQVGVAKFDDSGIITKGLIVRHLVLPEGIGATNNVMKFLAKEVCLDTFVSLMSQYTPYYKARELEKINRRISLQEYDQAHQIMSESGLHNGWIQESGGLERFAGVNIKPR